MRRGSLRRWNRVFENPDFDLIVLGFYFNSMPKSRLIETKPIWSVSIIIYHVNVDLVV